MFPMKPWPLFGGIWAEPIGSETAAALWENGAVYDLNTLLPPDTGWVLNEADDINNSGQIIGYGTYNGQQAAFLLTPTDPTSIPEPAAILLAPGFCLLASFRRRYFA